MTRFEGNEVSRRNLKLLWLIPLCAVLVLCYLFGHRHDQARLPSEAASTLSEEDLETRFSWLRATRADRDTEGSSIQDIDLSDFSAECRLTDGGTYRLSGSLNGSIRIDAEEQIVHLLLNNVTVLSPDGPALAVESAGKVILTLPENTQNILGDSGYYPSEETAEACVWSSADLTINGPGSLTVTGLHEDGIRSRNVLRIMDGAVTIKCKRTALHGTDGILVAGGSLNISSEKNGFRTNKGGAGGRGNLIITGGEHWLIAGQYAFRVDRGDLYIQNCVIHDKSVVRTSSVTGDIRIQSGCIQ